MDHKLTFIAHIDEICKKAGQKTHSLCESLIIACNMDVPQSCKNNKINRLHERCLRIIYNDKVSTFEQLLGKDSSVSIHARNLCFLAVEMFKVIKGLERQSLMIYCL